MGNVLHFGDNLNVLREHVADRSVDLIYLDPPFNSNASYNVLFKAPSGARSQAQVQAFEDTWHWGEDAEAAYEDVLASGSPAAGILRALRSFLGENDMMAYLAMMTVRLIEMRRALKDTGSLYLHCDPTASHYLKIILDGIFGALSFKNEIIWKRTSAHSGAKRYGPVHDMLLFYSKTDKYTWNQVYQPYDEDYLDQFYTHQDEDGRRWRRSDLTGAGVRHGETGKSWRGIDVTAKGRHWALPPSELDRMDAQGCIHWPKKAGGMPMLKRYLDDQPGMPLQDVFADIKPMHNLSAERLGYPTQKPLALLARLIEASSNPGDVILDPFCGCGTAIHAAEKLRRAWIGIDVTHIAIQIIEDRIQRYLPLARYEVRGRPIDLEGARELAARDKYQFQWWACSLIKAQPRDGHKKGADRGIDGVIYFKKGAREDGMAIVSVKGGGRVGPNPVRELGYVREREGADIGVLICLEEPTPGMKADAAAAGFVGDPADRVPRLQIIPVADLLSGQGPRLPPVYTTATALDASRKRRVATKPALPPEEARRQGHFPLPIKGGRSKLPAEPQANLFYPIPDPAPLAIAAEETAPPPVPPARRRKKAS